MTAANISINAVDGSNTNLPINTIVQLNNQNTGGETTFNWTIVDQPPGTADVLSNATIQNPTFTPKKEGTYLLKLVVNLGTISEVQDIVTAAVRNLKSGKRKPASGEQTESDAAEGWGTAQNDWNDRVDALQGGEYGIVVGQAAAALNRGDVVRVVGVATIKSGLPGAEDVATFNKALATSAPNVDELLGVVEGTIAGGSSVSNGQLVRVRHFGLYSTLVAGSPTAGDPVFVSDTATLALAAGTSSRKVGVALAPSGGNFRVYFCGAALP